jgi:hypothetical protein
MSPTIASPEKHDDADATISRLPLTHPLLMAHPIRLDVIEDGLGSAQALMQSTVSQASAHVILLEQSASRRQDRASPGQLA